LCIKGEGAQGQCGGRAAAGVRVVQGRQLGRGPDGSEQRRPADEEAEGQL